MKLHGFIKEKIRLQYITKGYNVDTEATIICGDRFYIADLLAIKDQEKIVIEIGTTNNSKVEAIKKLGYQIINVPFHRQKDKHFDCICGHHWKARKPKPLSCPRCKQYLFYSGDAP